MSIFRLLFGASCLLSSSDELCRCNKAGIGLAVEGPAAVYGLCSGVRLPMIGGS
jgi:hypothetical protein